MSCPVDFSAHHGGVYVKDIYKSVEWYRDILGFECMHLNKHGENSMVAFMKKGDYYIELFHMPECEPFDMKKNNSRIGTNHLGFKVKKEDFPKLLEYFREKGVGVYFDSVVPQETCGKPGGIQVMFIKDLDGTAIEFLEEIYPGTYK